MKKKVFSPRQMPLFLSDLAPVGGFEILNIPYLTFYGTPWILTQSSFISKVYECCCSHINCITKQVELA